MNENQTGNGQEVSVDMRRHSTPEYMGMIVGRSFEELKLLDDEGRIDGSGITHPEGFNLALDKAKDMLSSGQKPELIAVSPLERAKQTALLINGELTRGTDQESQGIPITTVDEFAELSPTPDDYEFSRNQMIKNGQLEDPNKISTGKESGIYFYTALRRFFELYKPDIEAQADAAIRRLQELAAEHQVHQILVISHGFNIGIIRARLLGEDVTTVLDFGESNPLEGYKLAMNLDSGLINITDNGKQ